MGNNKSSNIFFEPLYEYEEYAKLSEAIDKSIFPLRVTGCTDSQKAHLIGAVGERVPLKLIITENDMKAAELASDLKLYDKNVLQYPAKDIIFYSADVRGNAISRERLKVIRRLAAGEPVTVVTSIDGGMDRLLPIEYISKEMIRIGMGEEIDLKELTLKLTELGYERQALVENPGEYSSRGDIIDIFPLTEETPVRIELWGDQVSQLKVFDASSQRSIENVEEVFIYPATELPIDKKHIEAGLARIDKALERQMDHLRKNGKDEEAMRLYRSVKELRENIEYLSGAVSLDSYIQYFTDETVSLFDYFNNENALIFIDEPDRVTEKGKAVSLEFTESMSSRLEKGYILPAQIDAIYDYKKLLADLGGRRTIMISTMDYHFSEIKAGIRFDFSVQSFNSYNSNFELLVKDLSGWKRKGYRVVLLTGSKTRAQRLAEDLRERELTAVCVEASERSIAPGEIVVLAGGIRRGFEYPLIKFAMISESDIFGAEKKQKKHKKVYEGSRIADFAELSNGDYVVHESYGVGIYRGIENIEKDGVIKDYVKVEYAGGGTLYVRASAMNALQKYSGAVEGRKPKINKLDSVEWKHTKTRVKGAVREIAGELVKLYAERQSRRGYAFAPDDTLQTEFEEMFPFEETDDQLRAIEDTKRDMESTKIMDRLVCGDVGYGKTEIAIRAAFKAVQENKQVAFLVPTTILAQQHYNTFMQRMGAYGIQIEMLSRFRTPKQSETALKNLKSGKCEIIIGTHRLLSKDVGFHDLGLLIVDEEQRFGVTHKEKIKQMKGDVDVLTLTATPIPRTLHMSLIGIRDMSVLDEAPVDRLPIQTFVMEQNEEVIREAINRELTRGGQVYYVHNRVNDIDEVANTVQKLVPDAVVTFAHGQMSERELERIMVSFINGEIDVLVATTIIETGLDISNVNTIIIDDSDRLGLSQLYQLRGRVGRSNRAAYAFLMYKRDKMLKEVAEKRLAAIREFTELGSGFKIAMRDLEIRGAGNILGAEQSGHMDAVGYDLYCKMLNEAVKKMKLDMDLGVREEDESYDTAIDLDMDAFIPAAYIKNEIQKLDMYKRIAYISTEDELSELQDELVDRYGEFKTPVNNLLHIALLKNCANAVFITNITQRGERVVLEIYEKNAYHMERWPELKERYGRRIDITFNKPPKATVFTFMLTPDRAKQKGSSSAANAVFTQLHELFDTIKEVLLCEKDA